MKNSVLLLFIITAACLLSACEPETMLTIDQTSLSFTNLGGSQTITLIANKAWTISASQSWCKVSPSGGEEASGNRISITCDSNTTFDDRNCTVTITCAEIMKTISISQAVNNGLLISETTYEVTRAAQQLNIQVQANVKINVDIDNGCREWVKYNTTKGLTTAIVVLDIAENNTYDNREGKVTIKQDGGSLAVTLSIKQAESKGLYATNHEFELSREEQSLSVDIQTNVSFNILPQEDWIESISTKGLKTNKVEFRISENETYESRQGCVYINQSDGSLADTIRILQKGRIAVEAITLDRKNITLKKGEQATLHAAIKPDNATDKSVIWSSSNNNVVSVTDGTIKAKNGGDAIIVAKTGSLTDSCEVTVIVPVQSLTLDHQKINMIEGESVILSATILPEDATNKRIEWTSSDMSKASVDSCGKVQAVNEGEATITAKVDGVYDKCIVTIDKKAIPIDSIVMNKKSLTLNKGQREKLYISKYPIDATPGDVIWTSSNKNIVDVNSEGEIKAIKGGKATITAKMSGKEAKCEVTVVVPIESITLNKTSITVGEGYSYKLEADIKPSDATDRTIVWETGDKNIATVNEGTVTGHRKGSTTIKAKAGNLVATCQVNVRSVVTITYTTTDGVALDMSYFYPFKHTYNLGDGSYTLAFYDLTTIRGGDAYNRGMFSYQYTLKTIEISNGVTIIEGQAFNSCIALESVKLPNSVKTIDCKKSDEYQTFSSGGAFYGCGSLKHIEFGNSITEIGDYAFYGCGEMESVVIPNTVTILGKCAFQESKLKSIKLSNAITRIERNTFLSCKNLQSIVIPNNVTFIGESAFLSCSALSRVTFGSGIETIEKNAFGNCETIKELSFPKSLKSIGEGAFYSCDLLNKVSLSEGITSIEPNVFQECYKLSEINIPNSVTKIGNFAFKGCAFTSITIPASVNTIGNSAFGGCMDLRKVYLKPTVPPSIGTGAFDYYSSPMVMSILPNLTIYVPKQAVDKYKNTFGWTRYVERIIGN